MADIECSECGKSLEDCMIGDTWCGFMSRRSQRLYEAETRECVRSTSWDQVDWGPGPHPRLDVCNGLPGLEGECSRGTKGCNLPHAT